MLNGLVAPCLTRGLASSSDHQQKKSLTPCQARGDEVWVNFLAPDTKLTAVAF
jgi:hypothetical protein